ncbi:DUF5681 domain-containing protein [Sphingorhabdus sp.]|uniref:DUF5681 domain-containing protein n=1 Tax=Sphingorhabdus sp. TaxID=1902408 RepID=UPI0039195240
MKDEFDDDANNPQGQGDQSADGQEYKVGYGKPPKHTQFPHGNGPGKGKPKGAKNLKTIVTSATGAKVSSKANGKIKKISKIEAAMIQLANKAAAGDLKAIEKLIALYERYGPEEHSILPTAEETKADLETLQNYLAMHQPGDAADEGEASGDND